MPDATRAEAGGGGAAYPLVRMASDEDLPAVARMRAHWTGAEPGDDAGFDRRLADWWQRQGSERVLWVALADDGPAGMANLAVFERMPRPNRPVSRWGYLANLWVEPGYRRQRIGLALVDRVVGWSSEQSLDRVVLNPSEMSMSLYRSRGFRPAGDLLRLDLRQQL